MATPIAPLGMKILVHDTPEKRGSWQVHGKLGYYVGRALLHYHCHTVYMVDSRATRISDCLAWFPVNIKMPGTSLIEELTASVEGVRRILTKLLATNSDPQARQPLRDTEEILAEQLRAVRQLFQPNLPAAEPEQRVAALPPIAPLTTQNQRVPIYHPPTPPGFLPLAATAPVDALTTMPPQRAQPLEPLQQHQLVIQRPHIGIAPALPPDTTAPLQRVPPAPLQRVPAVPLQRVPVVTQPPLLRHL